MLKVLASVILLLTLPFTAYSQIACDRSVAISVSADATDRLVDGLPNETVQICGFFVTALSTTSTFTLETGTGTTCDTNTVFLMSTTEIAASTPASHGSGVGMLTQGTRGADICMAAGSGDVNGILTYRIQ